MNLIFGMFLLFAMVWLLAAMSFMTLIFFCEARGNGLLRRKTPPKTEPENAPEEPEPRRKSVDEGIDNLMTYSLDVAKENRRGRAEWP